jgi:hypothetical protein
MALSDYVVLAQDEHGKEIGDRIVSPMGIGVEIYKNWLYVRDGRSWRSRSRFTSPTVMMIRQGNLIYQDLNILALRGPQDGVYVVAWHTDSRGRPHGMIGCGTEAHIEDRNHRHRETGVTGRSLAWFRKELHREEEAWGAMGTEDPGTGKWISIPHSTIQEVYDVPDCFREARLGRSRWANQGSMFMSRAMGDRT